MNVTPRLWIAVGLLCVSSSLSAEERRPNVVIILADDLGYADVGVHGCRDIPTPNIDRLAASGVRCTSGYSAHPFCSPMRASLMTGRYQHRFGYERNIAYDPQNRRMGLPVDETTIATRLREIGYATGMVGKWHLGAAAPFHPNRRGFEFFYGFLGGGHDYFEVDLRRPQGEGYTVPLQLNGKPVDLDDYLTTALSSQAVGFIEEHRDDPFFLYVSYNAPHTPMQAPEAHLERFSSIQDAKRRSYAAMVSAMDDGIGEILASLERLEIRERTLVFFLSDNGGPERSNASRNDPLRGQKGDVFEGGIRVPFLVSWPGTLPRGGVYGEPVISIDVACTALAVAGVDLRKDGRLEGVNLVPFLSSTKDEPPHTALFWRKENGEAWAVRAGALKLLKRRDATRPALYDVAADPGETAELSANRSEDVARLHSLYTKWNESNRPPFFPGFREYHRIMDQHHKSMTEQVDRKTERRAAEGENGKKDPPRREPTTDRDPKTRSFRLGFTGFPHDYSREALAYARSFIQSNADILAHHIEGVPWAECLHGLDLSRGLLEDWENKRESKPKGAKVYLAISPGRGDLKVSVLRTEAPLRVRHQLLPSRLRRLLGEDQEFPARGLRGMEGLRTPRREWRRAARLYDMEGLLLFASRAQARREKGPWTE